MPEQTEAVAKKEVEEKGDSGSDSESEEDSIPELEETAGQTQVGTKNGFF
jgi:hypothetical protein